MAELVLYHHVQGLTEGVTAFADRLRGAGHVVHLPDLLGGQTFATLDAGVANMQELGFSTFMERGVAAADGLGPELVYAGFSAGVLPAQQLAQTRPGARGALFLHSCMPVSEFSDAWPSGVPVQVHGMDHDPFFEEDIGFARELVESTDEAELFTYPGDAHLFTDSSVDDFDEAAAGHVMERVLAFLDGLG